jgi:hypothetical protein
MDDLFDVTGKQPSDQLGAVLAACECDGIKRLQQWQRHHSPEFSLFDGHGSVAALFVFLLLEAVQSRLNTVAYGVR